MESRSSSSDNSMLAVLLVVIALIIVGVLVYFLYFQGQPGNNTTIIDRDETPTEEVPDSASLSRFVS